ncbi:B3 domain-containing transcription factor VAL3 isoform X3 [Amaranthus tricolor]|uniref:B3 domain-containing transcription factor VAL3 isoform X3 n=1 Tax=Amaranthus tricolor TaxID=29722 RepID=UPI00258E9F0E|nr:B3 domain-containing transcription factor VAL3 isoform X3 [Amaranthus tricolor]
MSSSSSSSSMFCFNSNCKASTSENWKKGWRLRNHEFARLCHRCGLIYDEGRFCEIFHKCASGWRCCETCGKGVHCGCIASLHMFRLLDAGGVECMICVKRKMTLIPNQMCPNRPLPGWQLQLPLKNWNQTPGSALNGIWYLGKNLANKTADHVNSKSRTFFEHDTPFGFERLCLSDRVAAFPPERNRAPEWSSCNESSRLLSLGKYVFGKPVVNIRKGCDCCHNLQPILKDGQCAPLSELASSSSLITPEDNNVRSCSVLSQQLSPQDISGKQLSVNTDNLSSSCRSQINNLKPVEPRVWKELHASCLPKISDEKLHQISGSAHFVITPLFEKLLSASDTGGVGRSALAKKSAEDAPVIGRPTIIVRDSLGKDFQWVQCDNCLKWRKLPFDYRLPARWTCVENMWNPERSSCGARQEISAEQLNSLLSVKSSESLGAAASKQMEDAELDAWAFEDPKANDNVIAEDYCEDSPSSTQPTTKHPRHELGCSCIVCCQPPSGGPKHLPNCSCKVCMMVKRRLQSKMFRRERNQTELKSVIQECKSQGNFRSPKRSNLVVDLQEGNSKGCSNVDTEQTIVSVKCQIDLNCQPEREDGSSCCKSSSTKILQDAANRAVPNLSGSINFKNYGQCER